MGGEKGEARASSRCNSSLPPRGLPLPLPPDPAALALSLYRLPLPSRGSAGAVARAAPTGAAAAAAMSRKQAARARPGKAEVERKRDERAARRALARERRNRAQGEGEPDGGGLNDQLRALGLRLREVPGDGNCLFRALGDQLEGHSRNHLKHRQDTVAYMIQQRADFEPFVEDDVPFEKHIANLAQPGTFAGNDAIVAFARNNQVSIVIHQQNAPLWQIHGTDKSSARELHIAYRYGEHYDSVRKINDNSVAPAWLQTEMLYPNEAKIKEGPRAKGEGQQPREETRDGMEDALQKVRNATGCSDVDLIAQVLEAEDYSIESSVFAVFQMKELEKLLAPRQGLIAAVMNLATPGSKEQSHNCAAKVTTSLCPSRHPGPLGACLGQYFESKL
ncbi:OTU domain-containing protein 3 isoform X3 [Crotalus tigris]|uniref:OTU domain-containing protein 3 isoform X3 n=1 Tax=Crotalus tigris TaxID=88082 RepID=UPI00192F4EA3|nr:OTU domain-containing protein 3 isoform X3 [Crotalus tigris]